jgi:hypothetical protein
MAEITVFSAGAVEGPLEALMHEFERDRAQGQRGRHPVQAEGGREAGPRVLSEPAIEALAKEGLVDAASRADLGRAETGLAVRDFAGVTPGGTRTALYALVPNLVPASALKTSASTGAPKR